jgi:putative glutamine amidotransferase
MQLVNVAFGGTLVQHLPDRLGHSSHCEAAGEFSQHEVEELPGSLTAKLVGAESYLSCSHHHQGVDRLGEGLVATAWSREDSLIEAFESPTDEILVGVQWHPEADPASALIHNFIKEACR